MFSARFSGNCLDVESIQSITATFMVDTIEYSAVWVEVNEELNV